MKCENQTEDMADILQHVQQYVAVNDDNRPFKTALFRGDQLSYVPENKLCIATQASGNSAKVLWTEWHALVCFYEVHYNLLIVTMQTLPACYMYRCNSCCMATYCRSFGRGILIDIVSQQRNFKAGSESDSLYLGVGDATII